MRLSPCPRHRLPGRSSPRAGWLAPAWVMMAMRPPQSPATGPAPSRDDARALPSPRRRWTIAVRLPVLVGLVVFISSVSTTHLAIHVMEGELDREVERLADVYIDSLSGVALPPLRAGDFAALEATLERGMGFQRGVSDLAIVVADPNGLTLARAGQPIGQPPMAYGVIGVHWSLNERGDMAWAQRELLEDGQVVALVAAQIAFPEQAERRRGLTLALMLVDLLLAAVAALLAIFFSRHLMRPFLAVTAALDRAAAGHFDSLPVNTRDSEASRLASAFNLMVRRLREREELATRLAERERAAVLGRLAASVAHEVRNPLAGMLTALDTIRRFGEAPAPRERAVDLVERGLRQIEAVVRTTLATHRQGEAGRPLSAEDLEDLKLLIMPEARRGGVQLGWRIDLPAAFPTDALRLRQLLLNLLLNAVAATPPGRRVLLEVRQEAAALVLSIEDEAGGLPEEAGRRLSGRAGEARQDGGGLGLDIAAELAAALGARIDIVPLQRGSRITVRIPPREENEP